MKILVLHSDIPADAPPEDQDTLIAAEAVAGALRRQGYDVAMAAFRQDALAGLIELEAPSMVFNLVEGVDGKGILAPLAPRLLAQMGVVFTGVGAEPMEFTCDKPLTKARMRDAGLATPDWSTPPDWRGIDGRAFIVKAALEDGSIGLDDGCVVQGAAAVRARADACAARYGGRWFAEEYVEGREFNIALLGSRRHLRILPMAEMTFDHWPEGKPRIVGYGAKWDEDSSGYRRTVRRFGVETDEPELAEKLKTACEKVWRLFGLTGFVRVDFRVTEKGDPLILEINVNPCISPDAGFAAAAAEAGMDYDSLVEEIVKAAQQ
ncbi:MAG TPA: ATP-grasp domain-containing protein [Rhizomicrobium sp.]|jgi:D-alanine-D-alanine ligase|nr:ATP-grasp domain-containing protein [Rhizomicrobium sp.]